MLWALSWDFWIHLRIYSFQSHYDPGVDSASNRNEYQEVFLGVKAAAAQGWQPYHLPVPSWNLGTLTSWNPLGHSKACNGTDLPLPLLLLYMKILQIWILISVDVVWYFVWKTHLKISLLKMIVLQSLLRMQIIIVWNVCHQVSSVCTALYTLTRKFKSEYCQKFVVFWNRSIST